MPVPLAPRAPLRNENEVPGVSNVVPFKPSTKTRQKLSFDIYEHASGLVSIDAVVPMSVALAMLHMLENMGHT